MKALVVDDDEFVVSYVSTVLESEGYIVQTACNGLEALGYATERCPDLVLLDLGMPVMDGWTCCRLLRQHEKTAEIPVIVMSGDRVQAAVRTELDIEHFLRKPFEAGDLLTCVKKCLESARLRSRTEA